MTTACDFSTAADAYGSHPHVAEALKHRSRDKVTVLTKTWARDPAEARADLDRFRKELGTDYIDICLMHCLTEGDWTERYRGVMDVFSEAKEKGIIRAHGCSCHSIEALRAAAKSPWVEVDLVRINPIGSHMDADPDTVVSVLREMKAAGKGIVGMKILGQGDLRNRQDEALKYALVAGRPRRLHHRRRKQGRTGRPDAPHRGSGLETSPRICTDTIFGSIVSWVDPWRSVKIRGRLSVNSSLRAILQLPRAILDRNSKTGIRDTR